MDYDVIVLGGGSAGSSAATAATGAGAKTLMINAGELGGLCILRGCMPTKSMLAAAHAVHAAEHTGPFGVELEGRVVPDFPRIMERKDRHVARFKRAKIESLEKQPFEILDARGRFAEGGGIELDDGRVARAGSYVIATGSVPTRLPLPGLDEVPVLTSDDVMRLRERPSKLLVQGAGPIGLELAQFFARIGTEVVLVNRSPLLMRYDTDCGAELTGALEAEPRMELAVPGSIEQLEPRGSGLRARVRTATGTREVDADALLMAAGRAPALDHLALDRIGLETPVGECLAHDTAMRTANPSIFVAGDATGCHQILHLSNQEGVVAGHNAAGGKPPMNMDYRLSLQIAFTDPPFAQVGISCADAEESGLDVVVGTVRFPETGRAITMETRHGIWKVLADRENGEILGSSIVGPRADDLAHLISTLMYFRGTVADIGRMPWYHPTLSEVMIDLRRDLERQL